MFSRYESDVIGFESNWNEERDVVDKICQTIDIKTKDDYTMTNASKEASTQSDEIPNVENFHLSPQKLMNLRDWLENVTPMILAELKFNQSSSAFDDYHIDSDEDEKDIKMYVQQNIHSIDNNDNEKKMPIVELSWNSVGNMIAIATGYLEHDSWCEHIGQIQIYIKKGITRKFERFHETKLSSCASTVCFHPNEHGLIATASVSGDVWVYNLSHLNDGSNREPLVCSDSYLHSGKMVSCLLWLNNEQISKYLAKVVSMTEKVLVSAGTDGKVIFWTVNLHQFTISQTVCYELTATNKKIKTAYDISCIDFHYFFKTLSNERKDFDDMFVVGCRTGELLVCRTSTAQLLGLNSYDPFVQSLESHNACILSLKFSFFKSNIILTLGADQELRIYDTSQMMLLELILLENEYSQARWVPSNKNLVVLTAVKSSDFIEKCPIQVFNIENKEKISISPQGLYEGNAGICSLEFLNKDSNLLMIGDVLGTIAIIRIPFNKIH